MYKYADLVEEVIAVILDGYSSVEATEKVMKKKLQIEVHKFMLASDWTEIMNRAGSKASYIIRNRQLDGTLQRVPKKLVRKHQTQEGDSYKMGGNLYGKKLNIYQKMEMEFKRLNAVIKNESQALNKLIRKFDINIANPEDSNTKAFYKLLNNLKTKK
ncbi:MAG: hypothetical protein COB60_05275 [Flavobacteriaceae bacterium]|nr:MAG: hypothetical protein COB60_05275 [Flavobacteriaceae bacterium]